MKKGRRARGARTRGFTLIEVMVALGVLMVGVFGLMGLQMYTIRSSGHAREVSISTQIAQQWIERLKQDAHTWNTAGTTLLEVQSAMNDTTYLKNVAYPATKNVFLSPVPSPSGDFVTNIYDFRGTPLPQDGGADADGVKFPDRMFYCVSYRTNWVYFGRAVRVEVRVWWPREGGGAVITDDFSGFCQDEATKFGPGGTMTAKYHLQYLSTVIRMVPVVR